MHLELMRDKNRIFPSPTNPEAVTSARVWHCAYTTLAPLSQLTALAALAVASYPDATLEPLSRLDRLEELRIVHLPQVSDLSPLSLLKSLRRISLATLPSWDSSGRVQEVLSLAPLATLPNLEELDLFGVVPPGRAVSDLLRSPSLQRVRLSKFPQREIDRIIQFLHRSPRANPDEAGWILPT